VLQLRNRRKILKFIGRGIETKREIEMTFGLNENMAEVHLTLLEKAMPIEKVFDGAKHAPKIISYSRLIRG